MLWALWLRSYFQNRRLGLDQNFILTLAAFVKWIKAEPMSVEDIERILNVIQNNNLGVSLIDSQKQGAIQVRIRQILNSRFGGTG